MTGWCENCPYPGRSCKGIIFPDQCEGIVGGEPGERTKPTPSPSVAQSLAIARAVRECPHRSGAPSCGCEGMARCALALGPRGGDVSHADCWDCRRGELAVR